MYVKTCDCGIVFKAKGPAGKYCEACKVVANATAKERNRQRSYQYKLDKNLIALPGVGKGGAPHSGELNPQYVHGKYTFETLRNKIKETVRYCQRCNEDLQDATHYFWVVHHKDHNHWNHALTNLELLCKRCHQVEHECWKAFTKEQRLSRKGVGASASKC